METKRQWPLAIGTVIVIALMVANVRMGRLRVGHANDSKEQTKKSKNSIPDASNGSPPAPPPTKPGMPSVKAESFLYLSMAESRPSPQMEARSCLPNSALIFLSFRGPVDSAWLSTKRALSCRIIPVLGAGTTWTTGRNQLMERGLTVEKQQGWMFEFFIFMDNDVVLSIDRVVGVEAECPRCADGDQLFRYHLSHDRPMRSSIHFEEVPLVPARHTQANCVVACFTDALVDAYHRTALGAVLPYNANYDKVDWSLSAYLVNIKLAAIAPHHCSIYKDIRSRADTNKHTSYPRRQVASVWRDARMMANANFVKNHVPGVTLSGTQEDFMKQIDTGLIGASGQHCLSHPASVNFSTFIPVFGWN